MSKSSYKKRVYEQIEDCLKRGRIDQVEIRNYINRGKIEVLDRFDADDKYGECLVMEHRRNRGCLIIWI